MTVAEKFNTLRRACAEQKVCHVKYRDEPSARLIHPMGICLTLNRKLVIVCCQEEVHGMSTGIALQLRNLPIEDCEHIHIIERKFNVSPEFIEKKFCNEWLFHVAIA